jgi:aromatic ring-opening dioxygenase LigB subunit
MSGISNFLMIKFACFSPHPPLLLPNIGSQKDREKTKKTIEKLDFLRKKLKNAKPDIIIISSPHPDWGFNVPLYFLLPKNFNNEIKTFLTGFESPSVWFEKGKKFFRQLDKNKNYGLIASGDMSHCLKKDGPYGLHPDGEKFDKTFIKCLKEKDIENLLKLDAKYPDAAQCGLRSFCFILGILDASGINYQAEILSYEAPFGVGYLTANFKLS